MASVSSSATVRLLWQPGRATAKKKGSVESWLHEALIFWTPRRGSAATPPPGQLFPQWFTDADVKPRVRSTLFGMTEHPQQPPAVGIAELGQGLRSAGQDHSPIPVYRLAPGARQRPILTTPIVATHGARYERHLIAFLKPPQDSRHLSRMRSQQAPKRPYLTRPLP